MSSPLIGPPDVTTAAPDTSVSAPSLDISSLPVSPSGPMPVQAGSTDDLENQSLNSFTSPDQSAVQQNAASQPQKPSLWRAILGGALEGLAAGSAVNTKGMSGGSALAAGAGAGVNQVLNVVPKQNAELQQAAIQNAYHHAQLAQIQREMALAPKDQHEQYLDNAATTYNDMLKSGAAVPVTQPGDFNSAQQAYQSLTLKNPAMTYSIMPTGRDENGEFQYSAVQYPNSPTQTDLNLTDPDGNTVTIPQGTKASSVGQVYTNLVSKALDRDSKESIAGQNNATKTGIAAANNQTRTGIAASNNATRSAIADKTIAANQQKAALAAAGTNVVAFDPDYQNPDGSTGANVVLDKGTAQQRGLFNYKADPAKINATVAGFNDVQTKLNQLASVAMDPTRMTQVNPQVAADMLRHGHGIELGAFGAKVDTSTIDADLARADSLMANQATRDFVTATLGAHEAITQLPRLQTFGQSSRMTQQQMEAAQRLLPQPGEDASLAAQKMTSLQNIIDPLRKQLPIMPGATLIPSWHEQQKKAPAATHVYIPGLGTVSPIQGGR